MKPKLIMVYCKKGMVLGDFEVEEQVEKIVNQIKQGLIENETVQYYANENIFEAIRLEVLKNNINPTDVVFKYKNEIITLDFEGILSNWPKGFCDFHSTIIKNIVKLRVSKTV